tara:strand:+ start:230 stop:697 length:468 start_codon:yes stop_codon:yes gene_type:complete
MSDSFDYDQMVQDALMQVVRTALSETVKNGLPSPHHFYITFQTNRPDVLMPDALKEQHPEEMTIVLQHQFWDLKVTPKTFSVTLSFDGENQEITVPFTALSNFLDPSVKFGLQFDPLAPENTLSTNETTKTSKETKTNNKDDNSKIVTLDAFRKK